MRKSLLFPGPAVAATAAAGALLLSVLAVPAAASATVSGRAAAASSAAAVSAAAASSARALSSAAAAPPAHAAKAARLRGRPRPVATAGRLAPAAVSRRAVSRRAVSPRAAAPRKPIKVGTITIPPCKASRLAWCTRISVPLDYRDKAAGHIKLGFQWYPATNRQRRPEGTILAIEGGPGFPTTGSAPDYLGTFGPAMLARRNLLLVNLRGTGNSSAFLCQALQNWKAADGIHAYTVDTGTCGRQLNHTRKLPGGGYVQASDLYTTANAARDVALLVRRLRTGRVDYYGDSYATFFGQVLTARYARLLRSVTLDAAYPVSGKDPFYPHTISTARHAFDISCRRSRACQRAAPGSSWARISRLARYLRVHPVTGRTRKPGGRVITERLTDLGLTQLINNAGADSGVYRELDPAIRALLRDHDKAPLLRLAAQEIYTGSSGPVKEFNDGLYQATTCLDYPQPFRYGQPPAVRAREYRQAVAALPRRLFAPFTVGEWVTEPDEEFDACLDWPAPAHPDPPVTRPAPYAPRRLPVLVLSGDLDSLTTPVEGRQTARDMGPSARWILIRNDTHVNAMDDTFGCASGLVRQFIARPGRLGQLNASCATRTPEVRVLGRFAEKLRQVTAAAAVPGNRAGRTGRRLAAVGAAAVGDAVWRWYYGDGVRGWGLRGGTFAFTYPGSRVAIRLRAVRWTTDTKVSGTVSWNQASGAIRGTLKVTGPGGVTAAITLRYPDYVRHPDAVLAGHIGGRRIAATMPAP